MCDRIRIVFFILSVLSVYSNSQAEKEWIFEAAAGVASEALPFSSDWSGSIGSGDLLAREFGFMATYVYNKNISISSTIGHIDYWHAENIGYLPPPDWGWDGSGDVRMLYLRPVTRISSNFAAIDLGAILYSEKAETRFDIFYGYQPEENYHIVPVVGIDLGERDRFIYAHWLDAFPVMTGGGIVEIGLAVKSRGFYKHKFYYGLSGYQEASLGYKGEFRVYNSIAVTPGFSIGGRDRENVYTLTIGVKAIIEHSQKNLF